MSTVLSVTKRENWAIVQHEPNLEKGEPFLQLFYGYKSRFTPISIAAKDFKKSIQKNGQNSVFFR